MEIVQIPLVIESNLFSLDHHRRSKGVHVSEIIKRLEERFNRAKFRNDLNEEALEVYRMVGFMWERLIMETWLKDKKLKRPGEIKKDGVFMSPDLVNQDDWELEEWKCTWRSMGKFLEGGSIARDFKPWLWQIMSYLYALNMDVCTLRVLWINGDYGANRRPIPEAYRLTFDRAELKDNWRMLIDFAKEEGML